MGFPIDLIIMMMRTIIAFLFLGEICAVPVDQQPAKNNFHAFHKVESGDSLASVAQKYNVQIEDLKMLNGIKDDATMPAIGSPIKLAAPSADSISLQAGNGTC